uniref:Homeodomain interacting protein kinase 4 n=1 Tax=Pseudonaja textilis TaxID=8673 RepID=A0A670ZRJ0_PSETE
MALSSRSDFYDVFEILGKGTFGEVVKSWKRSTGEMVAIKILKNDSYRSRIIKNELKLLQTMSEVDSEESHIVQFHEFFHDELKFYLVFELLEQNLFDFQKEHNFSSLPVRHIRTVTMQVLRALAKLKELSIIHADLKPENIMLVDQVRYPFRVKVIDFGSASIFNEVRYVKEPYIQSRFYRAPEILLGLPFCEKLDMWSLGCVMAELHLGWPLYPGNNEYDQIRYICETQGMPRPEENDANTLPGTQAPPLPLCLPQSPSAPPWARSPSNALFLFGSTGNQRSLNQPCRCPGQTPGCPVRTGWPNTAWKEFPSRPCCTPPGTATSCSPTCNTLPATTRPGPSARKRAGAAERWPTEARTDTFLDIKYIDCSSLPSPTYLINAILLLLSCTEP